MINPKFHFLSSQNNLALTTTITDKHQSKPITRKPNINNFIKKKNFSNFQMKPSDRIRFISPTKAHISTSEETFIFNDSSSINDNQQSSIDFINYPFIKRCVSPKNPCQVLHSRNSSACTVETSSLSTVFEPSIQDLSNCQLNCTHMDSSQALRNQISELKKRNFQLNLLLDEKNQFIENQSQEHGCKIIELTQQLNQIKNCIQNSSKKVVQTQAKISTYQAKTKEFERKLTQTLQKLDKAQKQVKMYKAKYRTRFNQPAKDSKSDPKLKKYHQSCCQEIENHLKKSKINQKNAKFGPRESLNQADNSKILKKMKSETILQTTSIKCLQLPAEGPNLMKIHSNEQYYNEYINLQSQIQSLLKQIKYKDIEILTLRKVKCDFQKEKFSNDQLKQSNKKLLAKVQHLTEVCNEQQIGQQYSLNSQETPKKIFIQQNSFASEESEGSQETEVVEFELSPEKTFQKFTITHFQTDSCREAIL